MDPRPSNHARRPGPFHALQPSMIIPDIRTGFSRADAAYLVWLLARGDETARAAEEERLEEGGVDALLDDPRTLNELLTHREFSSAPPRLLFYLLVRHALLEDGLTDRALADYLAALLLAFGRHHRAYRVLEDDATEFHYLADMLAEGERADDRRAFLVRAHMGEFALWLSGIFPDYITRRVQRRGAPGLDYYEWLGAHGYRLAAASREAEAHGLVVLYRSLADSFPNLRIALNRVADRHLFPATGDRIERLLRQVTDGFRQGG